MSTEEQVNSPAAGTHTKLPNTRNAVTHKFSVNGHKGYLTVGLYDDGKPGEMFIVIAKEGSTTSGLLDVLATTTSIALQHGVPLKKIIEKWLNQRFDPSGFTRNSDIPLAKSIVDYLARWLAFKFLSTEDLESLKLFVKAEIPTTKDDVTALSE